ncbi:MAG: GldG family protein [Desulfurococcales archaeon]|nr:GldG family protein [Desulfurococcales archaeon]
MNMKTSTLLMLLVIGLSLMAAAHPSAMAETNKIMIGFDMAHGENPKYVTNITKELDYAQIVLINQSFDQVDLSKFDIIVLGQPTTYLTPEELDALANWLATGHKVLWIAGDSDYGSGNVTQAAVNTVAEYVGSHLRVDEGAIYDNEHNAQRFYRVLAQVYPDKPAAPVAEGITNPILAHGPDSVVYVYDNGTVDLLACPTAPQNVIRIARFYPTAYLADNNPPPPLAIDEILAAGVAPGSDATAETVTGCTNANYTFIAAEIIPEGNQKASMVIVSGESPYGDYEPTFAPSYYGVTLDGPKFIYNIFKWAYNYIESYQPPQVVTQTVTKTQTVTEMKTVTQTVTVTGQPVTVTSTVSSVKTTTKTQTVTTTSVTTTTSISKSVSTTTVEKSNTGAVIGASIIVFIAIVAAAYILKK